MHGYVVELRKKIVTSLFDEYIGTGTGLFHHMGKVTNVTYLPPFDMGKNHPIRSPMPLIIVEISCNHIHILTNYSALSTRLNTEPSTSLHLGIKMDIAFEMTTQHHLFVRPFQALHTTIELTLKFQYPPIRHAVARTIRIGIGY